MSSWNSDEWSLDAPLPDVLGGRWRLGEPLGRGANGEVYAAHDLVSGAQVAVKILAPLSSDQRARVRREIAALRILRLPGVVQLLDDGEVGRRHYIVMELVRGTWFPGLDDMEWGPLAPRAQALLQTLARVHAAGIIHRDLKPANVLVDPDVRLLDFGLARGPLLGETVTASNVVVGTPRYVSPEALVGSSVDLRADLYAVGVMLFEHLAGEPPQPTEDREALFVARVMRDAPPLESIRSDLPREATRLVDALLRRDPADRPRTALEALALLGGARSRPVLPRLGGDGPVRALLEAARSGRSRGIVGPPGSGKSRALREAAETLEAEGRRVVWTAPGSRPFESLAHLVGPPDDARDGAAVLEGRLRAVLAAGTVIVVDPPDVLDRWSREMLKRASDAGSILGLGTDAVTLEPLDEAALRPLFAGPDRLQHLPEDAARELFHRAGGLPARVAAEVDAWVAARLARLEDGRVAVDRTSLERLAGGLRVEPALLEVADRGELDPALEGLLAWVSIAWPHANADLLVEVTGRRRWELEFELAELEDRRQVRRLPDGRWEPVAGAAAGLVGLTRAARTAAHAAMARVLPAGAEGRLAHLVGARDLPGAIDEALRVGQSLAAEGHLPRALAVLEIGLLVARQVEGAPREDDLLVSLTRAAVASVSLPALEGAAHELERAVEPTPQVARCRALVDACARGMRGDRAGATARLEALGPLEPEALEEGRLTELLRLLAAHEPARAEGLLAELARGAAGDARREGLVAYWRAGLLYRLERYEEAAELHAVAAARLGAGPDHINALFGRATALLDGGHLDEARATARSALAHVAELRDPYLEARAEWILRSASYRAGEAMQVDEELLAAAAVSVHAWMNAQILMTEAAIAWRNGAGEQAAALAGQGRVLWEGAGFRPGATLLAALACAALRRPPPDDLVASALACPIPGLALQSLVLLAHADRSCIPSIATRLGELIARVPASARSARLEILAPDEALAYRPA